MIASNNTNRQKKKPGKTTAFFICLIVAIFLWLIKSLNSSYTYRVTIPVDFKQVPQNKKALHDIPNHLDVDIRTSGLKLLLILMNRPFKPIEINFNDLRSFHHNYIISPSILRLKKSIKFEPLVKHIQPDTLYFMEKSGNQKNIPIKANYTIKCEKGYGCKEPNIHPAFVTVTGDSTVLRKIDTIYTQSLELNRVNQKVEQELLLLKPSDAVFMSSDKVQLEVAVEKLLERTISVPIQVINPPINAKQIHLFPSRVKIKFSALQHDFAAFDTAGFKASVNASATRTGKSGIFLSMQPGNTFVLSIEPKETEILLIKK